MKGERSINAIKIGVWLSICCFWATPASARDMMQGDTATGSDSVAITGHAFGVSQKQLSASFWMRHSPAAADYSGTGSFLPVFNTLPGVRMEERSPGSYRLNIRGSALRSPFGVRNVKMYWNGIPFTDAGGNNYFNQLAVQAAGSLEVVRGPAGSMYGAGTGGLVLMQSIAGPWEPGLNLEATGGSFGTAGVMADLQFGNGSGKNRITLTHQQSDGYRRQTALRRNQFSWSSRLSAGEKFRLTAGVLLTDLYYETPGGLTEAEFKANPRAARPAAGGLPSAEQANAGLAQQNMLAGFTGTWQLNALWTQTTSVYGSYAIVNNAAIRNFESRSEPQAGGRTVFSYQKKNTYTTWNWQLGAEYQAGYFNTQVSRNKNGQRDSLLTNDNQQFHTGFLFAQGAMELKQRWLFSAGVSINRQTVQITRVSVLPITTWRRRFRNEWAPRMQLTYRWNQRTQTQVTFSRGFSPPTAAEWLPGTGVISTALQAERGNNTELAQRLRILPGLQAEWTLFLFPVTNALVQQRDASGGEFYLNAGSIRQMGLEASLQYSRQFTDVKKQPQILSTLSFTAYRFRYKNYNKAGIEYGGKQVPGVPTVVLAWNGKIITPKGWYVQADYYFNSRIWLNDANTARAAPFHLVSLRAGITSLPGTFRRWRLFAGVDNLLNQSYSAGSDINAAGGRFFNAAPARNWLAGMGYTLK